MPAAIFRKDYMRWGEQCFVVPEYAFTIEAQPEQIILSNEHMAIEWLDEPSAASRLKYDSNRTALWELAERIRRERLGETRA